MSKFTENKAVGFYVSIACVLLAIVTVIVYGVSYANFLCNGATAISWVAFGLLIAGCVVAVAMYFLNLTKYIHYVIALIFGLAFFFFVYGIYMYVSVMAYGIDANWNGTFFLNAGLFVALLVLSFANIFVKQLKDED